MCSFLIVGEKVIVSQYDTTPFWWVLVKAHIKSRSETDSSKFVSLSRFESKL